VSSKMEANCGRVHTLSSCRSNAKEEQVMGTYNCGVKKNLNSVLIQLGLSYGGSRGRVRGAA
jgi:hypothetical protein